MCASVPRVVQVAEYTTTTHPPLVLQVILANIPFRRHKGVFELLAPDSAAKALVTLCLLEWGYAGIMAWFGKKPLGTHGLGGNVVCQPNWNQLELHCSLVLLCKSVHLNGTNTEGVPCGFMPPGCSFLSGSFPRSVPSQRFIPMGAKAFYYACPRF